MFNNHFDKIYKSYNKNIGTYRNLYKQIGDLINLSIKDKILLDIGNGGQTPYDKTIPKKVFVYDISSEMLNKINDKNIIKIKGDARNLEKIEDESIDVILYLYTLHHINGKNKKSALDSLDNIIIQAQKKLSKNGTLIIVEPVLNNILYFLESISYSFIYKFLSLFNKDMVFIFSKNILISYFTKSFINYDIKSIDLNLTGFVDPLLGTFPGIVRIPAFLMPTKMVYFKITKII